MRAADWLDRCLQQASPPPAGKLRELAQIIADIRCQLDQLPDRGLWRVLERSGYLQSLSGRGELEAATRRENLATLRAYIEHSMASGLTPIEFMDRAALLQRDEDDDDQERDALNLMSLHRAKGLEFDTVALCGVEEGLLPHQRAIDEGESGIAEERRLLYVGITRARNQLLLTTARQRSMFGEFAYPRPSRFIAHLAPDLLTRANTAAVPASTTGHAFAIGAAVHHPSFGAGVILELEGAGAGTRVTVQFRRAGIKRLMLKYAALTLASDL